MTDVGEPTITTWFIIVTAIVWLLWDIYAYWQVSKHNYKVPTISMVITEAAWYSPIVPFIFGFLMGHFFW